MSRFIWGIFSSKTNITFITDFFCTKEKKTHHTLHMEYKTQDSTICFINFALIDFPSSWHTVLLDILIRDHNKQKATSPGQSMDVSKQKRMTGIHVAMLKRRFHIPYKYTEVVMHTLHITIRYRIYNIIVTTNHTFGWAKIILKKSNTFTCFG